MADTTASDESSDEAVPSTPPAYRFPKQARGIAKFEQILDAGHALIDERGLTGFSLYDVADRAGVASGSVYHFFPSLGALFGALMDRYNQEFARLVGEPLPGDQMASWQDIVAIQTERGRRFINEHRPVMLVGLGPGLTWQTRLISTQGDADIACALVDAIRQRYRVPQHPDPAELAHNALRCLESLWQLSFERHGTVTDDMADETNKVIVAYLSLYWPKYLEPVTVEGK